MKICYVANDFSSKDVDVLFLAQLGATGGLRLRVDWQGAVDEREKVD